MICSLHQVELNFIETLSEHGLISITFVADEPYLEPGQLRDFELIIRLYAELDINPEGIDAILHLLQRIRTLKEEVVHLRNRLDFYES
ncbi:MAG TPA: chaperone modulator CbpM [Sphingobacteriaceae bacterium]